jgi:anti-sigma regulatory factor (Ser/Thr protein kinase)
MILRLSLHLPEDLSCVRTTRLLSRCLLEDMCVDKDIIDDVESIVSELCSNVIRHARSQAPHFLMTLEYYKPKVIITVTDEGQGFAQENVLPIGTLRPDGQGGERYGGYGLSLVKSLSDKVAFSVTNPRGATVCVEKDLRYETERDANEAAKRDTDHRGGVTADSNS